VELEIILLSQISFIQIDKCHIFLSNTESRSKTETKDMNINGGLFMLWRKSGRWEEQKKGEE
jgi:hypothetical protein